MTESDGAAMTPPRPGTVLRVGVTGHRTLAHATGVAAAVEPVLARLSHAADAVVAAYPAVFAAGGARLVAVSALAEGADRIVAEAALAQGCELQAILPFPANVYRDDFADEASRAAFDGLLSLTAATFALDGTRADAPAAYELAGRVMLANIDLLLAVWDGEPSRGRGGTAEVVEEALESGIPVVVLDPVEAVPRLRWGEADEPLGDLAALDGVVRDLVAPPRAIIEHPARSPGGKPVAHVFEAPPTLLEYLSEVEQPVYRGLTRTFPRLLARLGIRKLSERDDGPGSHEGQAEKDWEAFMAACGTPAPNVRRAIADTLRPAFAHADALANYYSLLYRGAYIRSFDLAATAVVIALTAVLLVSPIIDAFAYAVEAIFGTKIYPDALASWAKIGLVSVELIVLLVLIFFVQRGRKKKWHRKWLVYRELAELLRPMRMLALIAADGPTPRPVRGAVVVPPRHDDPAGPASFAAWYALATRRMLPLPAAVADAHYLDAVVCAAADASRHGPEVSEIENQIGYNERTADRMQKLEHALHKRGLLLFWGSVAVCAAFLIVALGVVVPEMWHRHFVPHGALSWAKPIATFLTAALPTLGASLLAIRVQGDFGTVARRSRRTAARLVAIRDALLAGPRTIPFVSARVSEAAAAMAADVEDWQRLSRTRPLQDP